MRHRDAIGSATRWANRHLTNSSTRSAEPTGSAPPPVIATKYRLSIDTIEETWLKIIVDDQKAKQYRLNPGDHIELEGSRNFNLLIGNAGGIRLELNGKPVALSGKSGQVVNLQLP